MGLRKPVLSTYVQILTIFSEFEVYGLIDVAN